MQKWRSSTSTLSLEEADDLQAVVNDAFASRLSRDEDEGEWLIQLFTTHARAT